MTPSEDLGADEHPGRSAGPVEDFQSPLDEAASERAPAALLPSREPARTAFRVIAMVEQVVGGLLLVLILILVLMQVIDRYVPGARPWTGELARYSMVWTTFILAGYLVAYPPHHIAIHVIDFVARGRWLAGVKLFANAVVLATSLTLLYGTFTLIANDIGQVTPAGQMPLRLVNMVPLVGLALVTLRVLLAMAIIIPNITGRGGEPK